MKKWLSIILLVFTAACGAVPEEQLAADGKPLPKFYDLSKVDAATLQFRMLDAVNALRSSAGLNQLTLNAELTAAAATHSRDMALQNRPWHFGSDGSSPLDRAERSHQIQNAMDDFAMPCRANALPLQLLVPH